MVISFRHYPAILHGPGIFKKNIKAAMQLHAGPTVVGAYAPALPRQDRLPFRFTKNNRIDL
jgi:hypothetical protein